MSTDIGIKIRKNNVKSILKAFRIIEELDRMGELSIGELSQALSMDKATVHRLINTIKDAGYITQDAQTKKYANSIKLFTIGTRIVERFGLKEVARPYIEYLAEETKETINLSLASGSDIVYIDKIESNSAVKVGIEIGTPLPMYCTGMGKAILAFLPPDRMEEVIENTDFKIRTEKTVTGREALLSKLELIRQRGYSKDEEEYAEGLISFGAPIFDHRDYPIAAISISMPRLRYNAEKHKEYYTNLVKDTAEKISNDYNGNFL